MTYVSLYRKYRSQTFEDVMGQEHVTKTLQNALRLGKVAHAYLFCGTRGTGKTTTARLLAKALNCEKGPTPQPCNECPACRSVTQGSAIDIVELDAASHRSIRDVEDIRENVKFPPMELRHKVFIIDEAHQLSPDAKDAFLKTLEEPPAHTIFVLATTQPQSIPVTIRSRCQQFDFRRGSLHDIRANLKLVVEKEKVKIEDPALDLIALNADGSWRDGISLLEQVLAYTDGKITVGDVNVVLGTVTQDFLFRLADALTEGSERGALEAAAEAAESGKEIQQLLRSAAQHFRNLLFVLVTGNPSEMTGNEETEVRLREQAAKFSRQSLLRAIEVFSAAERDIRSTDQHRLLLELALLKTIEAMRPAESKAPPAPEPARAVKSVPSQPRRLETKPAPETKPAEERPAETAPAAPSKQDLPEFDKIEAKWEQVLQHVRSISISAHALLRDVVPAGVRNGSLVLHFRTEGHKNLIEKETDEGKGVSKRQALLTAIERVFGVPNARIICALGQTKDAPSTPPGLLPDDDNLPDPFQEPAQETLKDVLDVFPNAKIADDSSTKQNGMDTGEHDG